MTLIACSECGREISDQAPMCPHCGLRQRQVGQLPGFEYRSKRKVWGMPLVHIAFGFDPETRRPMVAKGFIAIGQFARGIVAIGGFAMGVVAFGGFGLGVLAFGGMALALAVAAGGVAIGAVAAGGLAIGLIAVGGLAIGIYGVGGLAVGLHRYDAYVKDPEVGRFFGRLFGWSE